MRLEYLLVFMLQSCCDITIGGGGGGVYVCVCVCVCARARALVHACVYLTMKQSGGDIREYVHVPVLLSCARVFDVSMVVTIVLTTAKEGDYLTQQ